jgi:hypothetical protein
VEVFLETAREEGAELADIFSRMGKVCQSLNPPESGRCACAVELIENQYRALKK